MEKPRLGLPRLDFPYMVFPVAVNVNLPMDGTGSHSSNIPEYRRGEADSHSPPVRCIPATPARWPHTYSGQILLNRLLFSWSSWLGVWTLDDTVFEVCYLKLLKINK